MGEPFFEFTALTAQNLSSEVALISDGVFLFADALRQWNGSGSVQLSCDDEVTWGHGYSITNYMKTVGELCQYCFSSLSTFSFPSCSHKSAA